MTTKGSSAQRGKQAQRWKGQVQGHRAWPKPGHWAPTAPTSLGQAALPPCARVLSSETTAASRPPASHQLGSLEGGLSAVEISEGPLAYCENCTGTARQQRE